MYGNASPFAIGNDRNGNVFVGGVFPTGHPDDGTAALYPAVVKYASDGQELWIRPYTPLKGDVEIYHLTVANDGSAVTLAGKTLTPQRCFGAFALAFSGNGMLIRMHQSLLPAGYLSSVARFANLTEDNRFLMVEELSPMPAERFQEKSVLALSWSDMNGHDQRLYAYPHSSEYGGWVAPRACLRIPDSIFHCGRVPISEHESAFMVVSFPYPLP